MSKSKKKSHKSFRPSFRMHPLPFSVLILLVAGLLAVCLIELLIIVKFRKAQENSFQDLISDYQFSAQEMGIVGYNPKFAPEWNITDWINADKPLKLSDLKGRVVVINTWSETCSYCTDSLPYIEQLYKKYNGHDVVVVGMFLPHFFKAEWTKEGIEKVVRENNITYPIGIDWDYSITRSYNTRGIPAVFLIDVKGIMRYYKFGQIQPAGKGPITNIDTFWERSNKNTIDSLEYVIDILRKQVKN